MGLFTNPPTTTWGRDFWQWILQTVSAMNGEIDAFNQRINLGGGTAQSDEVANARTDAHGTTYGALATRLDTDQLTGENALALAKTKADADEVNKYLSQINYTPTPVTSLADLQSQYPKGESGLFANMGDGYYYYWNGTAWTKGSAIQGSEISPSTAESILSQNGNKLKGELIDTPFSPTGTSTADDALYIFGKIFSKNYISRMRINAGAAGTVLIHIFETDKTTVSNGDNLDLTLVKTVSASIASGQNYVDIDYPTSKGFVIGLQGAGWIFGYDSFPYSYSKTFDGKVGTTYTNQPFSFNQGTTAIVGDISLFYKSADYIYQLQDSKEAKTLSMTFPSEDLARYPIVFDFTQAKVILNSVYVESHIDESFGWEIPAQSITLPGLSSTDALQSFALVYDFSAKAAKVISGVGNLENVNDLSQKIIAGFTVKNATRKSKQIYFWNYNRDEIQVIFQHAAKGTDESGGNWNTPELTVSQRIIDKGLYQFKYYILGDSITAGEDPGNSYKPMYSQRYGDIANQLLGLETYIDGIGGTTICSHKNGMYARIQQSYVSDLKYDIGSVFGGTNDYAAAVPMGTTDGTDTDMSHFYPAFESILKTAVSMSGLFFVITPTGRENGSTANSAGLTLEDYANAEIELAKKYRIPVLDLYHDFQFTAATSDFYKTTYMPDGLHPNPAGMEKLAMRVVSFIEQLVNVR